MSAPSLSELTRTFTKIGLLSFGGPAGQIALMHRILVDEKKWLEEKQYLHALNFCMLLPGPEAMQLATYTGWLLHGVKGGLIAGLLFILPGFAVVADLRSEKLSAETKQIYENNFQNERGAGNKGNLLLGVSATIILFCSCLE